jgi:tetratricopeptide (TPR) repeat protein
VLFGPPQRDCGGPFVFGILPRMLRLELAGLALATLAVAGCDPLAKLSPEGGEPKTEPEPHPTAAAPIIPDDDPAAITRFESMLDEGAYVQMIEELPPYLEQYPNSYRGQHVLGWAYTYTDRFDEAMTAFERALVLNPKWDNSYVGQGVVWRERGELDKAVAAYRKAIDIAPDYPEAYSSLVVIELTRGKYRDAYELGAKAWAKSTKKDPVIAANYAIACHYVEDYDTRDAMLATARTLGYKNMATLEDIVAGVTDPFGPG